MLLAELEQKLNEVFDITICGASYTSYNVQSFMLYICKIKVKFMKIYFAAKLELQMN